MIDIVDLLSEKGQRHGVEAALGGGFGTVIGYLSEHEDIPEEYASSLAEEAGFGAAYAALTEGVDESIEAYTDSTNEFMEGSGDVYVFMSSFAAGSEIGKRRRRQKSESSDYSE
jgi:hypothetical protein